MKGGNVSETCRREVSLRRSTTVGKTKRSMKQRQRKLGASKLWNRCGKECATTAVASGPARRRESGKGTTTAASTSATTIRQKSPSWAWSPPSFVRQPECNGCVERFIRTLKAQLLWVFQNVEELRCALADFRERYNQRWIVQRLGYLAPAQARRTLCVGAAAWIHSIHCPKNPALSILTYLPPAHP